MATRRRGGADLDDLKARLGYGSSSADPPAPRDEDSGSEEVDAQEDPSAEVPEAAEPPASEGASALDELEVQARALHSSAPAPAPTAMDEEDYANAVSNVEDDAAFSYDANATDPTLQAPGSKSLTGVMIAAVAALLLGVAMGAVATTANFARTLENQIIADATAASTAVQPRATRIRTLRASIGDLTVDTYSADFDAHLRTAMAEGEIGLPAAALGSISALMAYDERLSSDLVNFVVQSNLLSQLIQRHLALTERDREEIDRLVAGAADTRSYGVAIDLNRSVAAFQAFVSDPDANPYTPMRGERVSFESLDMVVEGEGEQQRELYSVTNAAGEPMPVLIHDLVLLDREQLLPPATGETALQRYTARAANIQQTVDALVATQNDLITQLDERGAAPPMTAL